MNRSAYGRDEREIRKVDTGRQRLSYVLLYDRCRSKRKINYLEIQILIVQVLFSRGHRSVIDFNKRF